MRNSQSGFTLIELVMVIVILGILAAFALPRFADLTSQARAASVQGVAGAMKSVVGISRAQQLANGGQADSTVTLDGVSITMVGGGPTAADILTSIQFDTSGTSLITTGAGPVVVGPDDGAGAVRANCRVTYTAGVGTTSITTPASVAVDVTVC